MPLDISAFRSIATQSPDKLVYVSGEKVKTTKTQGTRGPESFKAAVDAFIKAYGDHYGAKLGNMSRQSLQEFADGTKPLTASVVKQMLDYADSKMGSARTVTVGETTIDVSKIGKEKIPFKGFNSAKNGKSVEDRRLDATYDVFAAFACKDGGKVDADGLLRKLKALGFFFDKECEQKGMANPIERAEWRNTVLESVVMSLDNRTLSEVYQGIASHETEALKNELARLMAHPDVSEKTQRLAEVAFTDICRIESMVLQAVSGRLKDGDAMNRGGGNDVTTANLGLLVGAAAKGAMAAEAAAKSVNTRLQARGAEDEQLNARAIGDAIRKNELTINMHLKYLLGWEGLDKGKTPAFVRPGGQVLNAFQIQEAYDADPLETGYLQLRDDVEKNLFPEYGGKEKPKGSERPVYGALNTRLSTSGGADTGGSAYGKTVIVLKEHVKKQCTYTLDDTFMIEKFTMKKEDRAALEEKIVDALADKLQDRNAALALIRAPGSSRTALDEIYVQRDRDGNVFYKDIHAMCGILSNELNALRKPGAPEISKFDIEKVVFQECADFRDARGQVATYDNVESLFAQQTDFNMVKLAAGTVMRAQNPKSPILVDGSTYVEAQIHAPVSFETDVAEIRIDKNDIDEHFKEVFDTLPQEERDEILNDEIRGATPEVRKNHWIWSQRMLEISRIKTMTKDAPFTVKFYESARTVSAEGHRILAAERIMNATAYGSVKDDIAEEAARLKTPQGTQSIIQAIINNIDRSSHSTKMLFDLYGDNLENLPKWCLANLASKLDTIINDARNGNNNFKGVRNLFGEAQNIVETRIDRLRNILFSLDKAGVKDHDELRARVSDCIAAGVDPGNVVGFVNADRAGQKFLADLNKAAAESFAKYVTGGEQILKDAVGNMPPLGNPQISRFYVDAKMIVQDEISAIKRQIAKLEYRTSESTDIAAGAEERIAKKLAAFMEERMNLLVSQKNLKFPSEAERNALIGWATCAAKLTTMEELKGVYESSNILVNALESKLARGVPFTPTDMIDVFSSFKEVCKEYMNLDAPNHGEFGPDDRYTAFRRAASVSLSRLAARLGADALRPLADALNTPAMRMLFIAAQAGVTKDDIAYFNAFMLSVYDRVPAESGVKVPYPGIGRVMNWAVVPPETRALVAKINPADVQALNAEFAYNPRQPGVSFFKKIAAPARPEAMPQNHAQRKRFLKRMLPLYHANEKGFDYGFNYHGRAHATRAFIFSIAMTNILKERGVPVDENAACLAAAGHDTGRVLNGPDTAEQEAASAANTETALNDTLPGAPGQPWIDATKKNISAPDGAEGDAQRTIEGYIFKSADSIEIARLGEVNMEKFPFLREPLLTENGLVILPDEELRAQLVKEAEKLAELTSPRKLKTLEANRNLVQAAQTRNAAERDALLNLNKTIDAESKRLEREQTDTVSDDQLVDQIEKAIRDNPAEFPLLTKYYLNAG